MPTTPLLRASKPVKVSTNPFTTVAVILRGRCQKYLSTRFESHPYGLCPGVLHHLWTLSLGLQLRDSGPG